MKARRRALGVEDYELTVTAVTAGKIEATGGKGGKVVWNAELNLIESTDYAFDPALGLLAFPLEVGKKWDVATAYESKSRATGRGRQQYAVSVVAYEKVTVRAGSFDAFKLVAKGYTNPERGAGRSTTPNSHWRGCSARQ